MDKRFSTKCCRAFSTFISDNSAPASFLCSQSHFPLPAALLFHYYIDITPADEIERLQFQASSFNTGKRQSKIGRPTKKDRRDLDGFMEE
ncbi:MAG TPA: hypothetical protein VGN00_22725 [Puia sp.]